MNSDVHPLKQWTSARVGSGRTGGSALHRELLRFRLDHAMARDAVHAPFDPTTLAADMESFGHPVLLAASQAPDRATYLQRPDLGRMLSLEANEYLTSQQGDYDLVIILADGLSSTATHRQAPPLLGTLLPQLETWSLAPLVIAPYARVALQDEIGDAIGARAALILLGERPGLGSPDSLGAYLVHGPKPGNTDAKRNCVSNIRPEGLPPATAAHRISWLLHESRRLGFSGVDLKDTSPGLLSGS